MGGNRVQLIHIATGVMTESTLLNGAFLVYAAFEPALRGQVVRVPLIEKLALAGMLLSPRMRQRGRAASVATGGLLMSLHCALYLGGL